jgi:hypothetical protein
MWTHTFGTTLCPDFSDIRVTVEIPVLKISMTKAHRPHKVVVVCLGPLVEAYSRADGDSLVPIWYATCVSRHGLVMMHLVTTVVCL